MAAASGSACVARLRSCPFAPVPRRNDGFWQETPAGVSLAGRTKDEAREAKLNRDPRIDAYIARAQPFARPIIEHVRERVHATLPQCEESVKWGMPAYVLAGKILLMTPAFKAHAALNFWRGQELRREQADAEAMGQFGKLRSLDDLPPDTELDRLIREAADLARNAPAPRKPKHAPKPLPEMHPDFAAALNLAPEAKAYFEAFAPSCQREYLEWVAEAKRDETRAKRIATTIEWLSEGKTRNWKYERP